MAVTYVNTWKNILVALMSKLRAEMKCPVFDNNNIKSKGNQFIKLVPIGSTQTDLATHLEVREYNIGLEYYLLKRSDAQFQNYIFNQVSIIEALIHDNLTLTLADSSELINVSLEECELDATVDEDKDDYYLVKWSLVGTHFGNQS